MAAAVHLSPAEAIEMMRSAGASDALVRTLQRATAKYAALIDNGKDAADVGAMFARFDEFVSKLRASLVDHNVRNYVRAMSLMMSNPDVDRRLRDADAEYGAVVAPRVAATCSAVDGEPVKKIMRPRRRGGKGGAPPSEAAEDAACAAETEVLALRAQIASMQASESIAQAHIAGLRERLADAHQFIDSLIAVLRGAAPVIRSENTFPAA